MYLDIAISIFAYVLISGNMAKSPIQVGKGYWLPSAVKNRITYSSGRNKSRAELTLAKFMFSGG